MPDTVVIVGAGLAGLACALRLRAAGAEVRVVEAADEVGGRVRTDVVDGFRLDHGFQVFNTAYPEAARVLDVAALDLRPIPSGLISFERGRRERFMLPWRHPGQALSGLLADVGSPVDKAALAALTARDLLLPASRLRAGRERTTLRGAAALGRLAEDGREADPAVPGGRRPGAGAGDLQPVLPPHLARLRPGKGRGAGARHGGDPPAARRPPPPGSCSRWAPRSPP